MTCETHAGEQEKRYGEAYTATHVNLLNLITTKRKKRCNAASVGASCAEEVVQVAQASTFVHSISKATPKIRIREKEKRHPPFSPLPCQKESRRGCGSGVEERSQVCLSSPRGGPLTTERHSSTGPKGVPEYDTHSALSRIKVEDRAFLSTRLCHPLPNSKIDFKATRKFFENFAVKN